MRLKDIAPNSVVFSTQAVVYKKEPIVYFCFDENDFQALGPGGADIKSAMLVSFSQIIDIDKSILNIENIEPGQAFVRKNQSFPWELEG